MTVKARDVSVVLQGPVRFETPESVESVRRLLPEAELILSTWEDEDVSGLGPIRVLRSEKPSAPIQHDRLSVPNNLNRLIRSSKVGVAAVTRPYVLKMRSDMVLDSLAFLDTFECFPERGPMPLFAHKVLVPALFSRTAYRGHAVPFHLSDWAVFGLAQDVRALFPNFRKLSSLNLLGGSSARITSPLSVRRFFAWLRNSTSPILFSAARPGAL